MSPTQWLVIILHVVVAPAAAWHALLYKRDSRAAMGWVSVSLLFPLFGPFLYFLFGINRVQARARILQDTNATKHLVDFERGEHSTGTTISAVPVPKKYQAINSISASISGRSLVQGNRIEILVNGEQAYPAMLAAIENASKSVYLLTYILETNRIGKRFIDALARASARGVEVRVLIDGLGEMYSYPRASSLLRRNGIEVQRFFPPKLFPPALMINLRNHCKILLVDSVSGFTGGMNIGDRHLIEDPKNTKPTADLHFQLAGPILSQLHEVFVDSWRFVTNQTLSEYIASPTEAGGALCRTILDGPDKDMDKLAMILVGAVSSAQHSIKIMTPYFLPYRELIVALQVAASKGVGVTIILPSRNNLPYVHWATRNMLWELLQYGVNVLYQPPPFAHTKLFIVDDYYVLVGSANIDPRSLRLNYELAVETYDKAFADKTDHYFQSIFQRSSRVSLAELDSRSLLTRTRDAVCWLFSPYL